MTCFVYSYETIWRIWWQSQCHFVMCLQEETNPFIKAEHLLDHMYRRSDADFARFRVALRNNQQEHILQYLERLSESVAETGSTEAAFVQAAEEESLPVPEEITAENEEMEVQQDDDVKLQQLDQSE